MSLEQILGKDPLQATAILAALELKDKDETICRYPTCQDVRQATTGTGRPSAYCLNPEHNAVNNHRARQQLRAAATPRGVPEATSKRELSPAPGTVPVESLRSSVLSRIALLQGDLERYVTALVEISDPDVSAAHIRAALDQAEARVAEAQQHMSTEQALRLAAETALLAAQAEALSEREAAEQAIARLEEIETSTQHQIEEILRMRETTIEQVRIEAQQQREQSELQAKEAITQAQTATRVAQEEARLATAAALEARSQAATAERLINEAQTSLERERAEIDRLRKELAETIAEARRRAEDDRIEAQTALSRERAESDRVREELLATRKQIEQATLRADRLATTNDDLRQQLVQIQTQQRRE